GKPFIGEYLTGALELQGSFGDWRNITAHLNTVRALFAVKLNVENATTSHLGTLFADKTRARGAQYKAVSEHEGGQRPRRASGRWILDNPIFRRKHPRISSAWRWREHEHACRLLPPILEGCHPLKIEPSPINHLFVLDGNENSWIACAQ